MGNLCSLGCAALRGRRPERASASAPGGRLRSHGSASLVAVGQRGGGPGEVHETLASHHCPYQQQLGSRQINMTRPGHLSQNIYFITPLHISLSTFATISGMCRASNRDPLLSLGLGDKVPHSLCDGVPVDAKHLQQLRRLPASWHLAHGQAGDGDARLAHQGRAHGLT